MWSKVAGLPIIHQITAVQLQGFSTSPTRYTCEIHASRLTPLEVTLSGNLDEGAGRYVLARPWHPKALPMQTGSGDYWELLEQLMQPFNALLLKKLPHEEYRRVARDCMPYRLSSGSGQHLRQSSANSGGRIIILVVGSLTHRAPLMFYPSILQLSHTGIYS